MMIPGFNFLPLHLIQPQMFTLPLGYKTCALGILFLSCTQTQKPYAANGEDKKLTEVKSVVIEGDQPVTINTGTIAPAQLVAYAQTLKGIPYKYGSTDPESGFDCSGFITYVFNHFNIAVPRSSVDFTHVNQEIPLKDAKPGDLILFTGTDSTKKVVGHMGILVAANTNGATFIHSTSGKAYGVTETPLNPYYQGRYLKTIRVFAQNKP